MRSDVTALYVDAKGPYPELVADWWDETRNAKLYAGNRPVVAHPPCGPWSRLKFLCTKQDPACGPRAVEQVRAYGGVLEHPSNSGLFAHCGMPRPGELRDGYGGWTIRVEQVSWGHPCAKPTWLYLVGVESAAVASGLRTGGVATHRITNGPRGRQLPRVPATKTHLSPPLFAEWLVELAGTARKVVAA